MRALSALVLIGCAGRGAGGDRVEHGEAPTNGLEVMVADARSGRPLEGAAISLDLVPVRQGPPKLSLSDCEGEANPGSPLAFQRVTRTTDSEGRARFSAADLLTAMPVQPSCPPGAPCAQPEPSQTVMRVARKGYVAIATDEWRASLVRLVPSDALVPDAQGALRILSTRAPAGAYFTSMPLPGKRACLGRDGAWTLSAPPLSFVHDAIAFSPWFDRRPGYLPGLTATVDAISGGVLVHSCPGQGTPLRATGMTGDGAAFEDLVTGHAYLCPPNACSAGVSPGDRYVVASYATSLPSCAAEDAAPVAFDLRRGSFQCMMTGCRRAP